MAEWRYKTENVVVDVGADDAVEVDAAAAMGGEITLYFMEDFVPYSHGGRGAQLNLLNMKTTEVRYLLNGEARDAVVRGVREALSSLNALLRADGSTVVFCVVPRSDPASPAPWLCEAVNEVEAVALERTEMVEKKSRDIDLHARTICVKVADVATVDSADKIVIVDDIYTSGSTMEGCLRMLREAAPGKLVVFFAAGRTV